MVNELPPEKCFGKFWAATEVECAGGLDPTYTNPANATHRRDRCKWYQACASRTTTSKLGASHQQPQLQNRPAAPVAPPPVVQPPVTVIDQPYNHSWQRPFQSLADGALQGAATALARYNEPARVPVRVPVQTQPAPQLQPQQLYYPHQAAYPMAYPQQMVPPWMAQMPQMVPMNYQAQGAQMPAYLSVPEPVVPGSHWAYRLGYSVLRSVLKASGHTMANFFDYTPIIPWPMPPTQPPSGTNA